MLRMGLIGLGVAAGCALLLTFLGLIGVAHFGPCGPDAVGMVFLLGFLITGSVGLLLTTVGLLQRAFHKLHP